MNDSSNRSDVRATVLVVDDDSAVFELLRPYFRDECYDLIAATSGPEAVAAFENAKPDVVVLDLMLPGMSGLTVLRELRQIDENALVLLLTGRADEVDRVLGLELGADDYVTKPFSPRELTSRIKAVLRRGRGEAKHRAPLVAEIITVGRLRLNIAEHSVSLGNATVALTPTEFKVLEVLAKEPGRVFSRAELLDRINRDSLDVGERSLDSHVAHLRQKLEPDPAGPKYIVTVYGFGYKLDRNALDTSKTTPVG